MATRGPSLLVLVLAVAGIAVSIYLTSVHYASVPLACGGSGVVDCSAVLTSSYSEVLGLPWSIGGIAWFAVSGSLAVVSLMRNPEPGWLQPAQVAWGLAGLAVVLYLVQVEVVQVEHICVWCTSMHVMILATLLIAVMRTPAPLDQE